MDCTNDKPCGKATRGPHSVVCVKATAQGLVARAGVKHVATLEGKQPTSVAQLPDGSVLVAQADAPPVRIGPGGAIDRLDLSPGTIHFAGPDRRVGCACGAVVLLPEGWDGLAQQNFKGWLQDDVVHRRNLPCYPFYPERDDAEFQRAMARRMFEDDAKDQPATQRITGLLPPERAGREGDQALPAPGSASVFSEVRRRLDEREATGVRRYGRSLETFNGRDACRDLEDELLDGLAYATQVRLEQAAIVEALLVLWRHIIQAPGQRSVDIDAAMLLAEKLEASRGR